MRILLAMAMAVALGQTTGMAAVLCVDDDNQTGVEDGSPLRPFSTVQAAIQAAADSDEIRVAAGTYAENVVVDTLAVTLIGGFSGGAPAGYAGNQPGDFSIRDPTVHVTTLQGDGTVAVLRFLRFGSVAGWTTVDGFRITGGTRGVHLDGEYPSGEFERFLIKSNVIEGNGGHDPWFAHRGGGIALEGSEIHVVGNLIRDNTADTGAGVGGAGHALLVQDNTIRDNVGYGDHGGGLWLGGDGTVAGNRILDNRIGELAGYGWGGGLLVVVGQWTLSGNLVAGNTAPSLGGGVFVDEGAEAWLDHELYVGNHTLTEWAGGGAGLYVDGAWDGARSSASLRNCTIAANTSPGTVGGNGIFVELSDVVVVDSVVWGNSGGDDFHVEPNGALNVTYTLSEEPWPGVGNLSLDPLFADPANGDFHLRSSGGRWDDVVGAWVHDPQDSPAVDAGDPASAFHLEPRPNGGRVNLGAYGNTPWASRTPGQGLLFADGFESGHTAAWSATVPAAPTTLRRAARRRAATGG